jgi:putative tricarboxylic transport membrane protein
MKFAQADFYSGLALGALGAYIIVQASRWEYLGQDGPGPGFFPLWYGIAMAALSLVLVINSVFRKDIEVVDWRGAGRAFATWVALAASVAALKLAGFLISFAVLTFFIVAVMYRRPVGVAAIVALALAAGFYVVFPLALDVKLP